jgi:glycosyltransferase involved in cell wall biosynthesis
VYALRTDRSDESRIKRWGTRVFYALINAADRFEMPPGAGDFRVMDRAVVDALLALPERNRFMKGLYAWVGFRTEVLPYTPLPRHAGKSSFSMRRLAALAFTGVTAFTNAPLRLWSALGACIALAALLFGLETVIEYFVTGIDVPGWATLVTGLMFSAGIQLLSVGILGEYVGRIFDEVKQRPVYIVGEELGRGLPAARRPEAQRQEDRLA